MTNNVFQDIESQIDSILDSAKEFYSPTEGIVDEVVVKIFIELIPTIRDKLFFDPDGALIYLENCKEEHRRKYNDAEKNSTNNTTEFNEDSFFRSQDDKFFHGVLIKITDLIASKIRTAGAKLGAPGAGKNESIDLPEATGVGEESTQNFKAIDWGAIFYYAKEVKETTGDSVRDEIRHFKRKHGIQNSEFALRNAFYRAKKSINESTYAIDELRKIINFINEFYPNAAMKLKNDIFFIEGEMNENQ